MFEFIDRILTHNGLQGVGDHNKWKMLDCCILGLMAHTVNNSFTSHVDFKWADQQTFPSMVEAFEISFKLCLKKLEYNDSFIFSTKSLKLASILIRQLRIFPSSFNSLTNSSILVSISSTPFVLCCFLYNFQMTSSVLYPP